MSLVGWYTKYSYCMGGTYLHAATSLVRARSCRFNNNIRRRRAAYLLPTQLALPRNNISYYGFYCAPPPESRRKYD